MSQSEIDRLLVVADVLPYEQLVEEVSDHTPMPQRPEPARRKRKSRRRR